MAHFVKLRPGGWTDGVDTIAAADLTLLDNELVAAVNGDAGGTWAPTAPVVIGGGSAGGMTITLSGGATPNYPAFGATPTLQRYRAILEKGSPRIYAGGSIVSLAGLAGPIVRGSASGQVVGFWLDVRDGATLTNLVLITQIVTGHGSLPTTFPQAVVQRVDLSTGAHTTVNLCSTGAQNFPTPGNVAAYEASGNWQFVWTFALDQNNVVAKNQYAYCVVITDESGGGALPGNQWSSYKLSYTLPDTRET